MQDQTLYNEVTFVLLAGGKSTRMGSDKGKLVYNQTSFSDQLITIAKELTSKVLISVGKHNADSYSDLIAIEDTHSEKGPIGGVVSVIPHIQTNWFFIVSVDTPLISKTLLHELWRNKEGYEAVVYNVSGRIHPLVGLYNTSTRNGWVNAFKLEKLKVTELVRSFNLKMIEASPDVVPLLKNINTPEEYKELSDL